jgi:hypothetical protein
LSTGRIWIDWRLVCFAAMFAVGAPGQAVVADVPIVVRVIAAVVGMLAWWYLFRCVADTLGRRILPQSRPVLVPVPCPHLSWQTPEYSGARRSRLDHETSRRREHPCRDSRKGPDQAI